MADEDCGLCVADKLTVWHFEDDFCWVADCRQCKVPMVVARDHRPELPPELRAHVLACLRRVADSQSGGYVVDTARRSIPHHFHAHARPAVRGPRREAPGDPRPFCGVDAIACDMDGVLVQPFSFRDDWEGRLSGFSRAERRYWEASHRFDRPVPEEIDAVRALEQFAKIVVVTSRFESLRPQTSDWLRRQGLTPFALIMRRSAAQDGVKFKAAVVRRLKDLGMRILAGIDDEAAVRQSLERAGVTTSPSAVAYQRVRRSPTEALR